MPAKEQFPLASPRHIVIEQTTITQKRTFPVEKSNGSNRETTQPILLTKSGGEAYGPFELDQAARPPHSKPSRKTIGPDQMA